MNPQILFLTEDEIKVVFHTFGSEQEARKCQAVVDDRAAWKIKELDGGFYVIPFSAEVI
jgi:hypothetical protein